MLYYPYMKYERRVHKMIELVNASKKYNRLILDNINVSIHSGESIGLIGHNGCGKSTLLKILGGFLSLDTGERKVKDGIRFSYVPEHFPPIDFTVRAYLTQIGRIEQMNPSECETRIVQLAKEYYIEELLETTIRHLSKGSAQKVSIIQAILKRPDILLLDEPLSGQDMDSQQVFVSMMKQMRAEGTAIVMACHEKWLLELISEDIYEVTCGKLEKREGVTLR